MGWPTPQPEPARPSDRGNFRCRPRFLMNTRVRLLEAADPRNAAQGASDPAAAALESTQLGGSLQGAKDAGQR